MLAQGRHTTGLAVRQQPAHPPHRLPGGRGLADVDAPILLKEHLQGKWLRTEELTGLDWADADIAIVGEVLGMDF